MATAITVDVDIPSRPADGIIDEAFRVQHRTPHDFAFSGLARVTFLHTAIVIEPVDQPGWTFFVDSFGVPDVANATDVHAVVGLSHHWGRSVQQTHEATASSLLTAGCLSPVAGGGGSPSCDNCQNGGPGASSCVAKCDPESSCDSNCTAGYFACCNCPSGCGCCPTINQRPAAHSTIPSGRQSKWAGLSSTGAR